MEGGDQASLRAIVTSPSRWRLSRLRRQAWAFWAVIVATVVVALASVAYAGRSMSVSLPSAVALGLPPVTKASTGGGAPHHQTLTVVQPSHPVEVLDGGERSSTSSPPTASASTVPGTGEHGDPQTETAPTVDSAPTPVDDTPTESPLPAGSGSGTGNMAPTTPTTTTSTTTTVPSTTTTTWGESDDGPDPSERTSVSGSTTGDG
ncbi:MAG: hypothetical protein ACYDEN_12565 [Acidimicrobiales bacterium]